MNLLKEIVSKGLWQFSREQDYSNIKIQVEKKLTTFLQKLRDNFRSAPLKSFLLTATMIWIFGVIVLAAIYGADSFLDKDDKLDLNELGDYLAGAFSPLAFLWLIYGYYLQQTELKQNTKALEMQTYELNKTLKQHEKMVELETKNLHSSNLPQLIFSCSSEISTDIEPSHHAIYFENIGQPALSLHIINVKAIYNVYDGPDKNKVLNSLMYNMPVKNGEGIKYILYPALDELPYFVSFEIRAHTMLGGYQKTYLELVFDIDTKEYRCQERTSELQ